MPTIVRIIYTICLVLAIGGASRVAAQTPIAIPDTLDDLEAATLRFEIPAGYGAGEQIREYDVFQDGEPVGDVDAETLEFSTGNGIIDLYISGKDFYAEGDLATSAAFSRIATFADEAGAQQYAEGLRESLSISNAEFGLTYEDLDPSYVLPDLDGNVFGWQGTTISSNGDTFYHSRVGLQSGTVVITGEGFAATTDIAFHLASWVLLTQIDCLEGAIACSGVQVPTLDAFVDPLASGDIATVVSANANVRTEPSTTSDIATTLVAGDEVTIAGILVAADGYNWYPITTADGAEGWIATQLIEPGA